MDNQSEICRNRKSKFTWHIASEGVTNLQVRHSQRCNDTPLSCWIICESTGEVCCAHCNCMAGLGEVCTHVAAVLFFLETSTRLQGKATCTQQQCQWVIPSYKKVFRMPQLRTLTSLQLRGRSRLILLWKVHHAKKLRNLVLVRHHAHAYYTTRFKHRSPYVKLNIVILWCVPSLKIRNQ